MVARTRPRLRLRVREVVPTSRCPNFRDAGRMVDRPLLSVIASCEKKYGECFASERSLREMIEQDTGRMPGVNTIPTALERLAAAGIVTQVWLKPGGLMPDGGPCTYGTRLVAIPKCRASARALASRLRRREGTTGRPDRKAVATFALARAKIARSLAVAPVRDGSLDRAKALALVQAAELEAKWKAEAEAAIAREPDKPPE